MKAMILSAGFGKRCRPLTDTIPKPILPILGIPCIEWILMILAKKQITKFVLNIHHLPDTMKKHFETWKNFHQEYNLSIELILESPIILDTGGGIFNAKEHLDDSFFWVVNSDSLFDLDLESMLPTSNSACCVNLGLLPYQDTYAVYNPVWVNAGLSIQDFGPPKSENQYSHLVPMHFTGIQLYTNKVWQYFPGKGSYSTVKGVFPHIIHASSKNEGTIHKEQDTAIQGTLLTGEWLDTGTLELYNQTQSIIANHIKKNPDGYWGSMYHSLKEYKIYGIG